MDPVHHRPHQTTRAACGGGARVGKWSTCVSMWSLGIGGPSWQNLCPAWSSRQASTAVHRNPSELPERQVWGVFLFFLLNLTQTRSPAAYQLAFAKNMAGQALSLTRDRPDPSPPPGLIKHAKTRLASFKRSLHLKTSRGQVLHA